MPDNHAAFPFASFPLIKPGLRHAVNGLTGSADALAVAAYARQHRRSAPMVAVVCAHAVDAQRLAEEDRKSVV